MVLKCAVNYYSHAAATCVQLKELTWSVEVAMLLNHYWHFNIAQAQTSTGREGEDRREGGRLVSSLTFDVFV